MKYVSSFIAGMFILHEVRKSLWDVYIMLYWYVYFLYDMKMDMSMKKGRYMYFTINET